MLGTDMRDRNRGFPELSTDRLRTGGAGALAVGRSGATLLWHDSTPRIRGLSRRCLCTFLHCSFPHAARVVDTVDVAQNEIGTRAGPAGALLGGMHRPSPGGAEPPPSAPP